MPLGIYLPQPAAAAGGAQLQTIDYRRAALTSPAAGSDGLLTCTFDGPEPARLWLIERITVTTNSTTATACAVYAGPVADQNLIDSTYLGNGDVADEAAPALVESAQPVTVQWTGASAGSVGVVTLQFLVVERVNG